MNQYIQTEYLERYLALKPIYDEFKYAFGDGEEDITSAFCVLNYIKGFDDIKDDIKQEINKNYFETSSEPTKYVRYAEYYIQELDNLIKDIPLVNEEQVKKWLLEFFKIHYIDFNSIFYLLKNEDSLLYLGDDWLQPGDSPSIYPEVQNGIYHFTKRETVKIIKKYLNKHLDKTISKKNGINTNGSSKINMASIALFYIYSGIAITDKNCNELAKKISPEVKNGKNLQKHFYKCRERNDRIVFINNKNSTWKLKQFDQAIELLKKDDKEEAVKQCENDKNAHLINKEKENLH